MLKKYWEKKRNFKNNFNGTKRIVNFCKKKKINLIFASSTSVYGDQSKIINSSNNQNPIMINPQAHMPNVKLWKKFILKKLKNYVILRLELYVEF